MTSFRGPARPVVGVFGGSFDPPHLGHAMVPAYLFARGLVDSLLIAPVADHPFGKSMRPFDDRLLLTRAAVAADAGHGRVVVSDLERRLAEAHGGPSRTLRLLEAVGQQHPDASVRLIVGSDIIEDGQTARWHRWPEIEARFEPIVVPRAALGPEPPRDPATVCALPAISSTAVRGWWDAYVTHRRPADRERVAAAVPAAVLQLLDAMADPEAPRVWVVGQGHVAAHVTPWLRMQGIRVVTIGGHALVAGHAADAGPPWPTAVWVLVRDAATASVARALATLGLPSSVPVLHGAGAVRSRDPAALATLADAGHPVGTLHPICSLRSERPWPSALPDAAFGLEGDPAARAVAQRWVGGQTVLDLQPLDAPQRRSYHAACALAANHLAVLEREAAAVLVGQGHGEAAVTDALATLLRSALTNLLALGTPGGITGPVSRGDTAAVAAHLAALPPQTATLYAALTERLSAIVAASDPG